MTEVVELPATSPNINKNSERRGTISYAATVDHFSSELTGWVREPTVESALKKILPPSVFSTLLYWEFCIVTKKLNPSPDFRYIVMTEDMMFPFGLGMKKLTKKLVYLKDIIDVQIQNEGLFWMDDTSKRRAKKFRVMYRSDEKAGTRVFEFLTYRTNGDQMLQQITSARQSFTTKLNYVPNAFTKEELRQFKKNQDKAKSERERFARAGSSRSPVARSMTRSPTAGSAGLLGSSDMGKLRLSESGEEGSPLRASSASAAGRRDTDGSELSMSGGFVFNEDGTRTKLNTTMDLAVAGGLLTKAQQRKVERKTLERQRVLFEQLRGELMSCSVNELERKADLVEELAVAVKDSQLLKKFLLTNEALVSYLFDEIVFYRKPRDLSQLVMDAETEKRMRFSREDEIEYIVVLLELFNSVLFDSTSIRQRLVLFLMPKPRSFSDLIKNMLCPIKYNYKDSKEVDETAVSVVEQKLSLLETQVELLSLFEGLSQQAEHEHYGHRSVTELVKEIEKHRDFRTNYFGAIVQNMSTCLLYIVDSPTGTEMEKMAHTLMLHLHVIVTLIRGSDSFKHLLIGSHREELRYYLSNQEILEKLKEKESLFAVAESIKKIREILKIWGGAQWLIPML